MKPVKTFTIDVKDQLGWSYPSAFVVVREVSISSQRTYISADGIQDYTSHDGYEAVAYRANFWPNEEAQQEGLPSRPLINLDNEEDETLFVADTKGERARQIIESALTSEEKDFRLLGLDITNRFA